MKTSQTQTWPYWAATGPTTKTLLGLQAALDAGHALRARRVQQATAAGSEAYEQLLDLAESDSISDEAKAVSTFLAFVDGRLPFDCMTLREVSPEHGDNILVCLDVLRWNQIDLRDIVANGRERTADICDEWGFEKKEDRSTQVSPWNRADSPL